MNTQHLTLHSINLDILASGPNKSKAISGVRLSSPCMFFSYSVLIAHASEIYFCVETYFRWTYTRDDKGKNPLFQMIWIGQMDSTKYDNMQLLSTY